MAGEGTAVVIKTNPSIRSHCLIYGMTSRTGLALVFVLYFPLTKDASDWLMLRVSLASHFQLVTKQAWICVSSLQAHDLPSKVRALPLGQEAPPALCFIKRVGEGIGRKWKFSGSSRGPWGHALPRLSSPVRFIPRKFKVLSHRVNY